MTFRESIRRRGRERVPFHEHDGSDISGEIVASVMKAEQFLGGTITGEEVIIAGGVDGIIRSDNFVAGSAGWRNLGDGSAEYNNMVIRGSLEAGSGDDRTIIASADGKVVIGQGLNSVEIDPSAFGGVSGPVIDLFAVEGAARIQQGRISATANVFTIAAFGGATLRFAPSATPIEFTGVEQVLFAYNGTAALPTIGWVDDINTGPYRPAADEWAVAVGGVQHFRVTEPSASVTRWWFSSETNDYIQYDSGSSPEEFSIVSGDAEEFFVSSAQARIPTVFSDSAALTANVHVTSTGRLRRDTSAARYKKNIAFAPWLADIPLRPVEFDSLEDVHRYGLIADEVAKDLPDAAEYNSDGEVENFDVKAVLAILVAKVNRLEAA